MAFPRVTEDPGMARRTAASAEGHRRAGGL